MTRITRRLSRSLLPLLLLAVSACVSQSSGTAPDSFMGRMKDRPAEKTSASAKSTARAQPSANRDDGSPPAPRPAPPKKLPGFPDTRVMLYQPKGDLLLILVNDSHTGRATEAGRVALSLGESNRAYKILTNAQMDALLKSLGAKGYEMNSSEFVQGDEQYLAKTAGDLPRYQGIISIEQGASKTKVLGYRKASEGDALGLRRYQAYTEMKGLVQKWFGDSSQSEFPVGGVNIAPGDAR